MKVSEIVKNITEIQDSNYVKFMNEEEIKLFKKYTWLVWNQIKRIKDVEVVMKIADNQITLERIMDKPEQWYSVLIDVIPKGKYIDFDDFSSNATSDEIIGLVKGISNVAKKLGISVDTGKGYRALANISGDGGQEVPHLHFHLFGGEKVGKMVE